MAGERFRFGPFELDAARGTLLERGVPVPVGARGVALLKTLLEADGRVVSRTELLDGAWPDATVEDNNLTVQIAALRKFLGATDDGQDWIATVSRIGYRFAGRLFLDGTGPAAPATPASPNTFRRRPAVAVLPFRNLSSDPEQEFFADGFSEDLITDLSKVPGLVVIARNSSFTYKGRSIDAPSIAKELGVRYVVDGSVRRFAERVRINAELTDAVDNAHLWAERYDGDLKDIFVLQDEVVGKIVHALAGVLPSARHVPRRHATSVEAYDLFIRGRVLVMQSPENNRAARPLLRKSVEIDPAFADGHAWHAMSHHAAWAMWGESRDEHRLAALASATRAMALDPENADARMILAHIHTYDGDLASAAEDFTAALRINPNHADAWALMGDLLVFEGRADEAVDCVKNAFRLNPYPPRDYHWALAFANYAAGRYEEAVEALRGEATHRAGPTRILAAGLARLGRAEEARAIAVDFLAAHPDFSAREWARSHPFRIAADRDRFLDGYRMAGLPG
jgi:TolB-like protein